MERQNSDGEDSSPSPNIERLIRVARRRRADGPNTPSAGPSTATAGPSPSISPISAMDSLECDETPIFCPTPPPASDASENDENDPLAAARIASNLVTACAPMILPGEWPAASPFMMNSVTPPPPSESSSSMSNPDWHVAKVEEYVRRVACEYIMQGKNLDINNPRDVAICKSLYPADLRDMYDMLYEETMNELGEIYSPKDSFICGEDEEADRSLGSSAQGRNRSEKGQVMCHEVIRLIGGDLAMDMWLRHFEMLISLQALDDHAQATLNSMMESILSLK